MKKSGIALLFILCLSVLSAFVLQTSPQQSLYNGQLFQKGTYQPEYYLTGTVVPAAFAPLYTSASGQVPLYAFNGAFADYQISFNFSIYPISEDMDYLITNVNNTAQSFDVSETYSMSVNGYSSSASASTPASFSQPSPFPAANLSDLSNVIQEALPSDIFGQAVITQTSLTPNVVIAVPAGTFSTYEVSADDSALENSVLGGSTSVNINAWVDSQSGLLVEMSISIASSSLSMPPITMVLESTNIPISTPAGGASIGGPASAGSPSLASDFTLYITIIVAATAVAAAGGFLAFRRRQTKATGTIPPPPPPLPPPPP